MSRRKLTAFTLKLYENERYMFTCTECKKELVVGDYIDHFCPYYTSDNICKECLEKED